MAVLAAALPAPVAAQLVDSAGGLLPPPDFTVLQPSESTAEPPTLAPPTGEARASAITCLAQAIAYEAGTQSESGQAAVAQVVLNRMRHPAFPKTVCGVVFQGSHRRTGCQFTFTCDGSLARVLSRRTWDTARRIAEQSIDGLLPAVVANATHYHADYVQPYWVSAMVRIGAIGAHIFYRFPGSAATAPVQANAAAASTAQPEPFRVWGLPLAVSPRG